MSERELLHTDRVLVVEGKYDAARLSHLTDAMILLTDGFGIYKDKKRQQLLKALAKKNGLILFTDSDAAGFRIRIEGQIFILWQNKPLLSKMEQL